MRDRVVFVLLHFVWQCLGPFMFMQMEIFHVAEEYSFAFPGHVFIYSSADGHLACCAFPGHVFIYSSADGHLACCPVLGFVNIASNYNLSYGWVIFPDISGPRVYLLLSWWTFRLLTSLGYSKYCCNLHWGDGSFFKLGFSQDICPGVRLLHVMVVLFFYFILLEYN